MQALKVRGFRVKSEPPALKSRWFVILGGGDLVESFSRGATLNLQPCNNNYDRYQHHQTDKMARRPARCYRYCKNKVRYFDEEGYVQGVSSDVTGVDKRL
jgi:hypothetical protein